MTLRQAAELVEAGRTTLRKLVLQLASDGFDVRHASSALAVAVAGALVCEGVSNEEFAGVLDDARKLWRMEPSADGPQLTFNGHLVAGALAPPAEGTN